MSLTLKNPVRIGMVLFEYKDPDGDNWTGLTGVALGNYDPKTNVGDWHMLDDNWTNLLAWDKKGKFARVAPFTTHGRQTDGVKHEVVFWDYKTSKNYPSFVLSACPTTPYETRKAAGHGDIYNPRNTCGEYCFILWNQYEQYA